ncbi:MAG: PEP-CTERM sorting domain-containing protein [Pseudomonadota bacterium]
MKIAHLISSALLTLAASLPMAANAGAPIVINPTSDGSIYTCAGCNPVADGEYVVTEGYVQGVEKFSTAAITLPVLKATLTLNPYGLPLWSPTVDIYGYGTTDGQLVASDGNAGTFLGTLTLPVNLGFGQDAFFDVTEFVSHTYASSPFLAFNLRGSSGAGNVFSSLEYNYGHPSQLLITAVPEPGEYALMLAGLAMVGAIARRRRQRSA